MLDDNFTLIPAIRNKIILLNWADLVLKSLESSKIVDTSVSKYWFNQNFTNPSNPDSSLLSAITNSLQQSEVDNNNASANHHI